MEAELRTLIARVRRRWFRLVALRTVARAAAVAAVPIVAALAIDAALRPEGWALILLGMTVVVAVLGAAGAVVLRMQRRPDDRLVARYIEERASAMPGTPRLDDELVSAVDLVEGRSTTASSGFTALILAAAVRHLRTIDPAAVVPPAAVKRATVEALLGTLALILVLTLGGPSLRRVGGTVWMAAFPDTIHLEVLPGDARVLAGQPLRIRTTIRGRTRVLTDPPPSLSVSAGDEQRTVPMVRDGQAYRFDFDAVDRTFRYRVIAGTASSPDFTVSALFPPRVQRIDVRYVYPSFSGLAPRNEEDGGDIYAPAGTRVRLRIHTDRAVASGELALGAASKVALRAAGEKLVEGELTLARDGSYRVTLSDADGLRGAGETEYFIRLMDDRPPDVRILRPSRDQHITPLEEVAIEARADDDYGITTFDLVYSVSGGAERVVPFARMTGTNVQKIGAYLLPAEELGVQPGDVITYYARAKDVGRGKRPTEAKSDMFFLEVKPFGEEFVAAQSQAGSGGSADGAQLEALISAQKEIINATWSVERRSAGGRSDADIKAIAQAQAELRGKAERMGRGRRGMRDQLPQRVLVQPQPPAPRARPADPIAAAVAAMTQAQQQLESQKTRDAIPHEMAALNALLQAQAEVRRRQVAQQRAGGGGGGSNRSGEDLSALFDKELQRQQRTNYETRSQVEERPDRDQSKDSSLDRIRDLARRQEELNRQQRELSDPKLSAEEIKRRLERLTRDQAELRQQAEELAKENAQQGQGSSTLRDASEQMRSATSDLRRRDAQSAAEKGERAAEQLRSLERQGRAGSGDGKQQRPGELQLEARQIAEAQRRLAAETERLERGGTGNAEATRRMADEKERLAGRVDELQRAAKQEGQTEAARELEREQVGQKMRETAKQLRGGSRPSSSAEQQMARTLDQVVEKLGGGADANGQRLAEEMKRTRAIRERLNRLEQQMRAAEQSEGRPGRRSAQPEAGGGRGSEGRAAGEPGGQAAKEPGGRGSGGQDGQNSGGELEKLRAEYQRELQRAREAIDQLQQGEQRGGRGATPEQHEYSRSAPGTEQFKQDRSKWESLRKDVDVALERYEAAASDRLSPKGRDDRLSAGASDRVPDKYRDLIAKYFQSLATGKRQ
jgi:hypothetical protein